MRTASTRAAVGLAAVLVNAWVGGAAVAQQAHAAPYDLRAKNVLLIVLDDVGTDKLSLFDTLSAPPYARTPRMDALAASGVRFTNYYTNTVCSASRACMQTGRFPFRTGMGSNTEIWKLPDSEVTLAELLRKGQPPERVYRCGAFGKWHIGRAVESHAVDNGYQRFYGTLGNTNDHFTWEKIEHDAGSPPSAPIPQTTWSASVVRDDALTWINAQERPFFAYVAFNPPHLNWQVPPKALLSAETQAELAGYPEGQGATTNLEQRRLFYRAMLEAVDTDIGLLLDGMDPIRRANTMVFIVADNGAPATVITPPHDPTHAKPSVYDLGIRVPMIVAGPLVPQPAPPGGWDCDELVRAVDLWRTIAEVTGASEELAFQRSGFSAPYPVLDSHSFLPLIRDPDAVGPNPWTFTQFFGPAGPYLSAQCLRLHVRAMSDGEYKYIRWVEKDEGTPLCAPPVYTHEFYHLTIDPGELTNLFLGSMTPAELTILEYLSGEMDALSEL